MRPDAWDRFRGIAQAMGKAKPLHREAPAKTRKKGSNPG
jgi:hypothetical protein